MKYFTIFSFMLITFINIASADSYEIFGHNDYSKVRIWVHGQNLQYMNQYSIIGYYAEKLCEMLNYRDSIRFDFCLTPNSLKPTDYYITYDSCLYLKEADVTKECNCIEPYQSKIINIVASRKNFNPTQMLQLLEYSILNLDKLKNSKHQLYERTLNNDYLNAIDTNIVNTVLTKGISPNIRKVLESKTTPDKKIIDKSPLRRKVDSTYSFYYFLQNNKYYIAYKEIWANNKVALDTTLLEFDDLYDFEPIDSHSAIVFNTPNSFYYLTKDRNSFKISKQHIIPYKIYYTMDELLSTKKKVSLSTENDVIYLGGNLIYMNYGQESDSDKGRTYSRKIVLLYQIDKDELIIDLEDFINQNSK